MINPEGAHHAVAGKDVGFGGALADALRDWHASQEWPPVSYAENDHILVWWLPEYDDALRQLVDEYQWAWRLQAFKRLESVVPEAVLRAWRDSDPLCAKWAWYNVLGTFAAARAKQLGIQPRPPQRAVCSCCSQEFLESRLSHSLIVRLGVNAIDVCETCLRQALHEKGSSASTPEAVTAVLRTLSIALQRRPKSSDLSGRLDIKGLSRNARRDVIQALRVKPTVSRVRELFGSWDAAVVRASASSPATSRLPCEPVAPASASTGTEGTSADSAHDRPAADSLPDAAFYKPLSSPPRGNARFVLVGGPMEYVDRRGEHRCVSGESPDSRLSAFTESVARMNAMVDGTAWMQAAAEAGQAIMASIARRGAEDRPYGHLVSYVTAPFRDIAKTLDGAPPKKIAEDAWRIGPVGKSRWSYQRNAERFILNANADFALMTVDAAPAVCIWGWPDRSDLCLQAFVDTVAAGAPAPVTVILPDIPALRDFARRYARGRRMEEIGRAMIEDLLYGGGMVNKRGSVMSAEFTPRLVIHPDGTEDDGAVLASALAYLDANHALRLSAWDVLNDALLRETAMFTRVAPRPFSLPTHERSDLARWYAQYAEFDDITALLRPHRPRLPDAFPS